MEIKMYLRMLQRGWWIIALSALVGLAASLILSYYSTPVYLTTSRFVVSPDSDVSKGTDVINSLNTLDKRSIVTTYAEVLSSNTIFTQALSAIDLTSNDVEGYTHSSVVLPDSNVLEVSVEGTNPQVIAKLADSIGQQAIRYIDGLNQGYNIRVLDPAQTPVEPIRPQPVRDASLAVVFGMVLGVSLAIIREQLLAPIEAFLHRSTIDEDTGVYSREYFDKKMEEALARSALVGFHTLGLIHLEGYVGYLDVIPKPLQQQVLRQVTKILKNELRGNDIIGRWDSATFSVLLPGTPGDAAVVTLGRVQTMLSGPFILVDREVIHLNPRIGLAERLDNESAAVLCDNAERAMKQAVVGNMNLVFFKSDSIKGDNQAGALGRL
jgi:diguanylate cyclase (GGDEF)-like protein